MSFNMQCNKKLHGKHPEDITVKEGQVKIVLEMLYWKVTRGKMSLQNYIQILMKFNIEDPH
jgi:hypothetical protein